MGSAPTTQPTTQPTTDPRPLLPPEGRLVVVGGGVAAATLCQAVRRGGFTGEVVVVGQEPHAPYDRPPLSKQVLLGDAPVPPSPHGGVADLGVGGGDVDLRPGVTATGLDPAARVVRTRSEDRDHEVAYDAVVVATGSEPVRLPGDGPQLTLRRWEDAVALRARLRPGARVVVVGAGWVGAEVATAALRHGADVTCLEAAGAPAAAVVGEEVADRVLLPLWRDVDLRLGTPVESVGPDGVRLAGGAVVPADVVVTGVGVRPAVAWLDGSGLAVDAGGVLVDEHLRAGPAGVLAVGDAAHRWSPRWGRRVRAEHWEEAVHGAGAAAEVLLAGGEAPLPVHDPVPYVWSDQLGVRLQLVGLPGAADRVVWREHDSGAPTALWLGEDGRLEAVLAVDRPREAAAARRAVGAVRDLDRLVDAGTPLHRA
ncbi:NAD(P)/FAD-dependent oxidoreductase [Aquipuribacter nitratireducens]|uniref:NAD(P)/FAD-dependent oxidoreductase n=1 Tax=Aquipuribacter nitratireducens TaxID=650104 RepID=A0ABW0GL27_9MICO